LGETRGLVGENWHAGEQTQTQQTNKQTNKNKHKHILDEGLEACISSSLIILL